MIFPFAVVFSLLMNPISGNRSGYDQITGSLIRYLTVNQVTTDSAHQIYGEWGSRMEILRNSPVGKKGESFNDSNCFVPAWIHCLLSDIYLRDQQFDVIPSILDKSILAVLSYEENGAFGFYPLKSDYRKWKYLDPFNRYKGHLHGPVSLSPLLPSFNQCMNTWNDADDTALGFLVMKLYADVNRSMNRRCSINVHPPDLSLFARYRDLKGRPSNPYNLRHRHGRATGAYCTYFPAEEYKQYQPFIPLPGVKYMPWGINEIDCVVNANILATLSAFGVVRGPDITASSRWITGMLTGTGCTTCGVYYPTPFAFHYSIAKALSRGAIGLAACIPAVTGQIISSKNSSGYWTDDIPDNDIQATLYAVNTLLLIADCTKPEIRAIVSTALSFLLNQVIWEQNVAFLPGGVFFSFGFFSRKSVVWKSDAFSTALLAEALNLAKHRQIPLL